MEEKVATNEEQAITKLLVNWRQGDEDSLPQLMTSLQEHLRSLAQRQFNRERSNHTLQPTALVSELFLKLQAGIKVDWRDRAHFFAVSATIMRRIMVDYARKHARSNQNGEQVSLTLAEDLLPESPQDLCLLDLDRALDSLESLDQTQHQIVVLRFFGGLTNDEIAEAMGVTERTVQRKWKAARVWLMAQLKES